jgi:hypothetical protein
MDWACSTHGKKRNAYRVFGGEKPIGRFTCRWEDNIKMDLRCIVWGGMVLCPSISRTLKFAER